jgi:hypothetical protein
MYGNGEKKVGMAFLFLRRIVSLAIDFVFQWNEYEPRSEFQTYPEVEAACDSEALVCVKLIGGQVVSDAVGAKLLDGCFGVLESETAMKGAIHLFAQVQEQSRFEGRPEERTFDRVIVINRGNRLVGIGFGILEIPVRIKTFPHQTHIGQNPEKKGIGCKKTVAEADIRQVLAFPNESRIVAEGVDGYLTGWIVNGHGEAKFDAETVMAAELLEVIQRGGEGRCAASHAVKLPVHPEVLKLGKRRSLHHQNADQQCEKKRWFHVMPFVRKQI